MMGWITVAAAQVADQQMPATEDVQRQEAIVIVITVEEAPFLVTVQRGIRSVEVQYQSAGRLVMGFDKLVEQNLVNGNGTLAVSAVLQTAQRGRAGQSLDP